MAEFNPADHIPRFAIFWRIWRSKSFHHRLFYLYFLKAGKMEEIFEHEIEGCYLYSRHWNPTNKYLSQAIAKMEGTESASVTGSGMAAITCSILQICNAGDEIVSSRTIYGGTYAFLRISYPNITSTPNLLTPLI